MALSRLYPLDMNLTFDDRLYSLGETIRVLVELAPRRDVVIREARLELVCEEDFVMSYTIMSPGRPSLSSHRTPGEVYISPPSMRQRVKKEEREAYVHSSAPLLGMRPSNVIRLSSTTPTYTSIRRPRLASA